MRKWQTHTVAFCVLFVCVWEIAQCTIPCYECNSIVDKNCEKNPSKKAKNCKRCVKIDQIVLGTDDQPQIIQRMCLNRNQDLGCEKREIRHSIRSDVCTCDTALCNGAPGPPRPPLLLSTAPHWLQLACLLALPALLTHFCSLALL